ncbi:hypothetical protein [Campylobacter sp.]|uniref:hypothetical protein n=1 Tax=Campylobacter sp. TaxID=205 RepID=UPI0026F981C2|nr:hypothetical protein [Campylobacter sp.]
MQKLKDEEIEFFDKYNIKTEATDKIYEYIFERSAHNRTPEDRCIELQVLKYNDKIWIGYFHPHVDKESLIGEKSIELKCKIFPKCKEIQKERKLHRIDIEKIINFDENDLRKEAQSAVNLIIKEKQVFETAALKALENFKQKSAQRSQV